MTTKSRPQGILARIIRDIPTFGGTIFKGSTLAVVGGGGSESRPANRWSLGSLVSGQVEVCCARRGQEFELIEAETEQERSNAETKTSDGAEINASDIINNI